MVASSHKTYSILNTHVLLRHFSIYWAESDFYCAAYFEIKNSLSDVLNPILLQTALFCTGKLDLVLISAMRTQDKGNQKGTQVYKY